MVKHIDGYLTVGLLSMIFGNSTLIVVIGQVMFLQS